MKMNKILAGLVAVASIFATSSCSEDDSYTPAEPETGVKPYVYFSEKNETTFSLEPTAPAELTFTVCRQDTKDAIEMPLIVTENTSNVFNVPSSVSFAAGEESVDVTVTFPDAPIGTPCSLTVGFNSEYTGIYYTAIGQQTFTVTRVKWNSLGVGTMDENFWFEDQFNVEILQRDDKPALFRIVKPFEEYASILDGNQSEYIELTLLQPKDVVPNGVSITGKNLVYFSTVNTGYFHSSYSADVKMYHPSALSTSFVESDFAHSRVLSYQEDGKTPGQIQLAPYYYMDGIGGWNNIAEDDIVIITFPGFVPKYEADIETDFEYDVEFEGEFASGLLNNTTPVELYVGTCTETKDDCDKVFEEKYGKIYKLVSPYAEDYNLTFFVKKGAVSLPEGEKYELQATGLKALGKNVFAKINPDASSYEDGTLVLNITFTDAKGEAEYGTTDEVLKNIKWISLGEGSMYEDFIWEDELPVEILQREDNPNLLRVSSPFLLDQDCKDNCSPFFELTLLQPNDKVWNTKITQKGLVYFNPVNTGYFLSNYGAYIMMYHPGDFQKYASETSYGHNKVLAYQEDGVTPAQIQLAPFYYMDDIGGWDRTQEDGMCIINFPSEEQNVNRPSNVAQKISKNFVEKSSINVLASSSFIANKYKFTVCKDGKVAPVKVTKNSAPSQIETLKF